MLQVGHYKLVILAHMLVILLFVSASLRPTSMLVASGSSYFLPRMVYLSESCFGQVFGHAPPGGGGLLLDSFSPDFPHIVPVPFTV